MGGLSRSCLRALGLVAVLLAAGACGPVAAPSAAPAPAKPPAGAAAPAAPTSAEAEWEQTVAAARREGKLVISAPTGALWRQALQTFEEDYPGISLEQTAGNSRDFWPRLFQERQADQYLWDMRIGGPDPEVFAARDAGALDPVRPLLVLPDVVDESKWFGGWDGFYADREKRYLASFIASGSYNVYVNRDMVPESELSSDEQLTDPRYRGKIVVQDPRGGAGLGTITVLLAVHGEQYVRDLLGKQEMAVTADNRQQAEWLVRKRYPIGIGMRMDQVAMFEREGVAVNIQGLGAPRKFSLGSGGIQLVNRAPHPNAAKVFINWLLTQPVQARIAKMVEQNSRRVDVAPGDPNEVLDPSRLADYVPHQYEELLPVRRQAQQLAAELVK